MMLAFGSNEVDNEDGDKRLQVNISNSMQIKALLDTKAFTTTKLQNKGTITMTANITHNTYNAIIHILVDSLQQVMEIPDRTKTVLKGKDKPPSSRDAMCMNIRCSPSRKSTPNSNSNKRISNKKSVPSKTASPSASTRKWRPSLRKRTSGLGNWTKY
mmetsp:Transcript_38684/g.82572  ORF Transcript_38684/g.82572 Transcript_38684/m.82572 type:complete len:158 (+) Transcript_38684:636-1109(+)